MEWSKINENELEKMAKDERNRYMRDWRAENRDKVKDYNRRYWLKRAQAQEEGADNEQRDN